MADKVKKIREEVERIQLYTQSEVLKKVLDYIDEVQKEPVSEDLREAARKYFKSLKDDCFISSDIMLAFKAGAKWQKEQMMANTADAMICLPYENKDGGYTQLIDVSRPLPVGNNKITIIFKED